MVPVGSFILLATIGIQVVKVPGKSSRGCLATNLEMRLGRPIGPRWQLQDFLRGCAGDVIGTITEFVFHSREQQLIHFFFMIKPSAY